MSRLGTSTVLVMLLAGACSPASKNVAVTPPAPGAPSAAAPEGSAVVAAAPRIPRRGIVTPLAGEPGETELAAARLAPETCAEVAGPELEAKIVRMRAEVDAAFKTWHAAQPACWQAMRDEEASRLELEASDASGGFAITGGSLGLGLSGIGVGGGGLAGAAPKAPAPARAAAAPRIAQGQLTVHASLGGAAGPAADATEKRKGATSGTNNQVAAVDEADIVKTDGRYLYLVANGALRIFDATSPRAISVTKLGGAARELFVDGDRAVVYSSIGATRAPCTYGYDCEVAGDGSTTEVAVYDVADRAHPKKVRTMALSGSLLAARRTGAVVHTVVADGAEGGTYAVFPPDYQECGEMEARVRAKFAKLKADNERQLRVRSSPLPTLAENGGKAAPMCGGLFRARGDEGHQYTSIVSFDLGDDRAAPTTASVRSRAGTVFASESGLYMAVARRSDGKTLYPSYRAVDEVSEIHRFAIGPRAGDTRYTGSGAVPGHVLNQFAMDEWNGYLRVATTKGRVPDPAVESELSILAPTASGGLARVGALGHLAPGEDIRSVRFDDDRAYVVTFKKTDPLFVLDTFDPQAPRVLGELKIPGFSTYLHRIDTDHLLSIGFDANDHGDFAYFDGVLLQLFDVKQPTEPRLLFREKIGTRGSSSEAATNHLAFNWLPEENLLAVPMTICQGGADGVNGDTLAFSGLLVYDVDLAKGFHRRGGINHGTNGAQCGTWWSNAQSAVKRSVFVEDLVFSIANDRMKAQRKSKLGTDVADLSLLP